MVITWLTTLIYFSWGWECGTHTSNLPQIQFVEQSERRLASGSNREDQLSPIRMHFHYYNFDLGSTERNNYFKQKIMASVERWFTSALYVYPLKIPLSLNGLTFCGDEITIPEEHKNPGVETDLIIYVASTDQDTQSYVAYAGACAMESSGRNNVVAGRTVVNSYYFNNMDFETQLITMIHEVTHLLGFSNSLYSYYKKDDGSSYFYHEVTEEITIRGTTKTILKTPNLLQKAREVFGCPSLQGVELEEMGGSGTAGSHWDRRVMYGDYMTSTVFPNPIYSTLTLALLKDTGWYEVNYAYGQDPIWGKDKGCDFFTTKCVENSIANFEEFCTSWMEGCDVFQISKGTCNLVDYYSRLPDEFQYFSQSRRGGADEYIDYCPVISPYPGGSCRNIDQSVREYFGEKACENCRCLEATLVSDEYSIRQETYSGRCHEVLSCEEDHAVVLVGDKQVKCPFSGGIVNVDGYNGYLVCPNSDILCGNSPCKNSCYGHGQCVKGKCQCISGYGAADCSVKCKPDCSYCDSDGNCDSCGFGCKECDDSGNCLSCHRNMELVEGTCKCLTGFQESSSEQVCVAICGTLCNECNPDDSSQCFACVDKATTSSSGDCRCIELAEYIQNSGCQCVKNSDYKDSKCQCKEGFRKVDQKCIECKVYFQPSEVTGYFSKSYTEIHLVFSESTAEQVNSCQSLIHPNSLLKLGSSPICIWDTPSLLKVKLGYGFTIREEPLKLVADAFYKVNGTCTYEYQDLEVLAQYSYQIPSPLARISAPRQFSFQCGDILELSGEKSTRRIKNPLSFSWKLLSGASLINDYISSNTKSTLSIPKDLLSEGEYVFELTVTNALDKQSSSQSEVVVKDSEALSVKLDAGNQLAIKSSSSISVKAFVESFCGTRTSVSFEWSYQDSDNNTFDPSVVLSNSKQPHVLKIEKGNLAPGFTYTFKVKTTEGSSSGEAFLELTVESSPLVVGLNKASGRISNKKDLKLDASGSYDPDGTQEVLFFEWSCYESSTLCTDSSGNQLLQKSWEPILNIPASKLRLQAVYSFCLKASKDTRQSQKCLDLEVVDMQKSSLELPQTLSKVNPQKSFLVWIEVESYSQNTILWKQTSGPPLKPVASLQKPYLEFEKNSMSEGTYYAWEISLQENSGASISMMVSWNTNFGPSCLESLSVSPSQGNALATEFTLRISNCFDEDGQDYPLYYSFGILWKSYYIPLVPPKLSESLNTKLFSGTNEIFGAVCDSLWTCRYYKKTITVGSASYRVLESQAVSESFLEDIRNPEMVPGVSLLYSESLELDQKSFSTVMRELSSFVQAQQELSELTFMATMGAVSSLASQSSLADPSELLGIISSLLEFDLDFKEDQVLIVLETIDALMLKSAQSNLVLESSQSLISKALTKSFKDSLPGNGPQQLEYGNLNTYRETIQNLQNTQISLSDLQLELPDSLPFSSDQIVDLELTRYEKLGNYSDLVDLSFYTGGTYSNFDLNLEDKTLYPLKDLSDPISIEIPFHKSQSDWECVHLVDGNWVQTGCQVVEVYNSSVKVNLTHTSMFTLRPLTSEIQIVEEPEDPENSESCQKNTYFLYITGAFGLGLVLSIIVPLIQGKTEETTEEDPSELSLSPETAPEEAKPNTGFCYDYFSRHLTLGMFLKSNFSRCLRLVIIFSELLFLSCLVKVVVYLREGEQVTLEKIGMVVAALTITSLVMFLLEFLPRVKKSLKNLTLALAGLIGLASLGCSIYMFYQVCESNWVWFALFGIGFASDVLVFQSLRSLLHLLTKK